MCFRISEEPFYFYFVCGVTTSDTPRGQNFKAQENVLRMQGRPIVLTIEEVNEIVDVILNPQITRRIISGPAVRGIIEKKYQKIVLMETLYQILRLDGRVRLCTAARILDSFMSRCCHS
jgi:hypothetical protein